LVRAYAGIDDGSIAFYPFNGNANDECGNGHKKEVNGDRFIFEMYGPISATKQGGGFRSYFTTIVYLKTRSNLILSLMSLHACCIVR
jgi:hypothetical protein